MISSEVQRTLVKSPPELWAELSDPAALARHLGELGEIKITKIEPEQTVEWEAEAARGKVELKPSGWGTKVTLSVFQELPDPSLEEAGRDGEGDEVEQEIPEQSSVEEVQARAADEAPAEADVETHDVAEVEMNDVATPQPHEDPEVQARQEPAAEGREAPQAGEDAGPEAAETHVDAEASAEPAEQAPRLGFFARLFRRKAKRADVAADREPSMEAAVEAPEPEAAAGPAEPEAAAGPGAVARPEAAAEPEAAAGPAEPEAAAEPEAVAEPDAVAGPVAADDPPEPVAADAPPGPVAADAAEATEPPPAAERPARSDAPADLSAELAAAEAALAAQTTRVLTLALDRLGAAHHRPFSRA